MITSAKKSKAGFLLETDCASHIPYARFVDGETIETKNGNLMQVIKINGLIAETMDDEWVDIEKKIRNSLLISLTDSTIALYYHTIRRKLNVSQNGTYENEFLQTLHSKWQAKLASQEFYVNEHYLTIVKKPPVGKIRHLSDLIKNLSNRFDHEERERFRQDAINELGKISKQILTQFAHYGVQRLSNKFCDQKRGVISESISFLYYLLNLEKREVVVPEADIATILPTRRLFFDDNSGTLALRNAANHVRYVAILAIKNYSHITYSGMLDNLLDVKSELVICQTFLPIEKEVIRSKVKEIKRNQEQSDDGQTSASDKINDVLDELGSYEATLGYHQLNILCQADSQTELEQKIADLDAELNQIGIIAVREDMGLRPAFFAMLPGNFAYITRKALVSSKNIAGLVSLHNSSTGSQSGNYWGDAIIVLETISGAPYYFNFHVMDVANTFLIGPMGSGKTLLESFLLAESMRFGGKLVAFDKDRGMEIFIRALDGKYCQLRMGERTGFAPFQLEDTPEHRYFLFKLLRTIASQSGITIDSDVEKALNFAIDGGFSLPQNKRVLRNVVPFLGMSKAGSLRAAFDNWVNNGTHAWIFDNELELLFLNSNVIGFDMTAVLEDTLVASVIYQYLFHRIESMMDGSRMRIVVAEGWRALQDEFFREKIRDWSSTPRKKNAFLVMDTQSPSDIAQSELACKIIQETVTQIYFANPTAEYDDYVGKFKLSEKEYQIIKSLNKSERYFLLKQGKTSVVVRADLRNGFENEIAILSGRETNVRLLDKIRASKGDDPSDWMSDFISGVRE